MYNTLMNYNVHVSNNRDEPRLVNIRIVMNIMPDVIAVLAFQMMNAT